MSIFNKNLNFEYSYNKIDDSFHIIKFFIQPILYFSKQIIETNSKNTVVMLVWASLNQNYILLYTLKVLIIPNKLIFRYLAVAASLTGGNALAAFIKMIQVNTIKQNSIKS
jgi:hypothetical protein